MNSALLSQYKNILDAPTLRFQKKPVFEKFCMLVKNVTYYMKPFFRQKTLCRLLRFACKKISRRNNQSLHKNTESPRCSEKTFFLIKLNNLYLVSVITPCLVYYCLVHVVLFFSFKLTGLIFLFLKSFSLHSTHTHKLSVSG